MKITADKGRMEKSFEIGDWVSLKLQPHHQQTFSLRTNLKLSHKFFGPFKVLEKIVQVAYRLELPFHSRIHPVFDVSCLKKRVG